MTVQDKAIRPEGQGAMPEQVDAVVVGAGFAGLYLVQQLRARGLSIQGIEAGGDVGGTWYWNRYPGARCDIPSLLYQYTWSEALRKDWEWSEKYATQPEILEYIEKTADMYDLRSAYRFDTRVASSHYDADSNRWIVTTDAGDSIRAQYVFMATGCLSMPKEPDFPGMDLFEGESYITGRWPHDGVDFKGKRVAVIGTGSSAIQSMPLIAKDAEKVFVFQRTPNFSLPAKNAPLTDEERQAFDAAFDEFKALIDAGEPGIPLPPDDWDPSDEELREYVKILWDGGGLVSTTMIPRLTRDERINEAASDFVRSQIRDIVEDPETAEKLTPRTFPIATKRACVDTDYYVSFNRDNVELVDLREAPIEAISARGVRTADAEYPVDIIVYALGFDAMTGALDAIDIAGRNEIRLKDEWAHGPKTMLGVAMADFPNLFTITGPNSPSVLTNVVMAIEQHVDFLMHALDKAKADGVDVIEVEREAQEAWAAHCTAEADATLFPRANSWYIGANIPGKPRVFLPYVGLDFKQRMDAVREAGFEGFRFERAAAARQSQAA